LCITLCATGAEPKGQKFGKGQVDIVSSMYKIAAGSLETKRMQRWNEEARKGGNNPGTIGVVSVKAKAGT
jgi:hypothetical protein